MFCVLGTRLYNFPLITRIHTDIPRIRANPWEVILRVRLVVLLGAKVPNVLTQGLVLCLCLEGCHVGVQFCGVCHTRAGCCCHGGELLTVCAFLIGVRFILQVAFTANGGVLAFRLFAVVVGRAVLFGDFSRDVMNWVFVGYYSHNEFGNEQEYDNKNYKQLDPKLSNISRNLFKTIQVNLVLSIYVNSMIIFCFYSAFEILYAVRGVKG